MTRFRIYEAYFRLGFRLYVEILSGGALPQAEINEWGILWAPLPRKIRKGN